MKTDRIDIAKVTPGAYQPLIELNTYIKNSSLPPLYYHLIKIRASLINGCAYCIQSHIKEALEDGENPKRIFALNAWNDSPYFSAEESAVLALTDEITLISGKGVSDEVFNRAVKALGEEIVSHVIMAVACINAWNRIGKSTLLIPE